MPLLDVFDSDAFNMQSLTLAIDKLPYMPGRIGELNLFQSRPITTRHAVIEERQGILQLVAVQNRGSSNQNTYTQPRRVLRSFPVPHMPQWFEVLAEDLEGKRAFGSEDQTEIFSQILNDRLEQAKQNQELTWEYHRIGALNGKILDADGSTVVEDFFADFGLTRTNVTVDFTDSGTEALGNPTMDMKILAQGLIRTMQKNLGNTPFTGVRVFCGNLFWDSFIRHWTVRKSYEYYQENSFLRTTQIPGGSGEGGFKFADVIWENYRGFIGDTNFVSDTGAFAFPTGTRDLFLEIPAPADFVEAVNTRGQPLYVKQERMKWDKGIELHVQSNVLYMCTRPQCLIQLTGENFNSKEVSGLVS